MVRRRYSVSLPLALLAVVSLLSLAARVVLLDEPCRSPCRTAGDHLLVFDEVYYVNAARVIAGITPPPDQKYATAPLGDDPNAEHPQLGKLLIAGAIKLLGDQPLAWRLPSLLFGSLAILAMFALVRAAGGGKWLAWAAAALMAMDNLLLVHGRIGTLDVPALGLMLCGVTLYLRGRPVIAGGLIGIGSCLKLVAPYAVLVVAVFEVLRWLAPDGAASRGCGGSRGGALRALAPGSVRVATCAVSAAGTLLALLALLDRIAPPYDDANARLVGHSPFRHLAHMLSYGAHQTNAHAAGGIASYPWTWLVDYKPITYLNINPARPSPGLYNVHPAAHFLGMISPAIILLALPALILLAWRLWRVGGEVPALGLAWFVGTYAPFVLLSVAFARTSYLYYMVIVMPGIYVAVAYLLLRMRTHRIGIGLWIGLLVAAVVVMYPFTPLP